MVKVIMHGCNGKMGQVISDIIANDADVEIVAGVDASDHIKNTYPVFANIKECNVEADVVIDFCAAPAVDGLLAYCVEKQVPCVLCTTGLSNAAAMALTAHTPMRTPVKEPGPASTAKASMSAGE